MKDKKTILVESARKNKVSDAIVDRDNQNILGYFIVGLALLLLISCGIYWAVAKEDSAEDSNTRADALKFKNEYEQFNHQQENDQSYSSVSIPEDNPVEYASFEKVFQILEQGTGVIYFGFPECPWCRALIPVLLEVAEDVGVETIYYLNALEDRDILELDDKNKVVTKKEATKEYQRLVEKLDAYLSDYVLTTKKKKEIQTGKKRLYFPTVVFVKDGEVVGFHEGTVESQVDPKKELSEQQKEELVQQLKEYMQNIYTCDGVC